MHELPLVFFTVFAQSAVGLAILAFISYTLRLSDAQALQKANRLALILLIIAFIASIFHLGQPMRAFNTLRGIGRSPMSNEIILFGIFTALLAGTVLINHLNKKTLQNLLNLLAVPAGLAFIWSITQVYQLHTIKNWATSYTSFQMWMTVLIGGGACSIMIGAHKRGAIALLIGVLLSLLVKPEYFTSIAQNSPDLAAAQLRFWSLQLICLAIGAFTAGLAITKTHVPLAALTISAIAVLIGELAARIAFYNLWSVMP